MNIRQYKKRYGICKDDFGMMIYLGDTVEVYIPGEFSTPKRSVVYWNMLDGAFIEWPQFVKGEPPKHRSLRSCLKQEPIPLWYYGEDEPRREQGYCKKVKSFYKE